MQSIICFTSDFGLDDAWVGVCHAVIHRACPQARVVDLGHGTPPFDIRKGAATAASGVHQIPDAIHLVVVDPGVGAGRADLCLVTSAGTRLVGPDNGVLLPAAERAGGVEVAVVLDASKIDFRGPLPTFHARDVLAPAAAALACGVAPGSLGHEVAPESLVPGPFGLSEREGDAVLAQVIEIDRFGTLRFNVPGERLDELGIDAPVLDFAIGHNMLRVPVRSTFGDVNEGEPVAMVDSSGWLTLAVNVGSAADRYNIGPGMHVHIRPPE